LRAKTFVILLFIVVFTGFSAAVPAAEQSFAGWLKDLRAEAAGMGISSAVISQALPDKLAPIPRILELDRAQPEGTVDFDAYLRRVVAEKRIQAGREKILSYQKLLTQVENTYNVERQVIAALWGVETSYGVNTGSYDIVNALATLAYDGRRSAFFRDELFKALKILDEGHVPHARMKGSWAGAMGQNQFMPTSFFKFAVDFNKDGRRDIWGTHADIFASTANYLASSGWKKGAPWGHRVKLPQNIDREALGLNTTNTLQFWHDKGVRMAGGKPVPFQGEYYASIIQPGGPGTSAFMVYDNFRVIMKWNKSVFFATSVGLLSDSLKLKVATSDDAPKKA
jgi:membrane-bound lytic murein transglycosylase B